MKPNEFAVPRSNKTLTNVLVSVVVAVLVSSGGVYAYLKSEDNKSQTDLQSQISSLQQQISAMKTKASAAPVVSATSSPLATLTPTPTPVPALTSFQLMNFAYNGLDGKAHTLKNGSATYPETGGTGSLDIIQDVGPAQGDLNGDDVVDTVVTLGSSSGGTGYWYLIAAVLNKNGQPVLGGEQTVLEDRATVKSVSVDKGIITVTGTVRSSGQPLSDTGNIPKTERYKLSGGKLISQQ